MEVHHHPHVPKERKVKEYLLEFMMIFLAVSLGFIAESIREGMVRREKEHHYIKSMIHDLKKDSADLKISAYVQQLLLDKMDSALSIPVESLKNIATQDTFFHQFFFFYSWVGNFTQNDNAYTQLRNGGFTMFRHQEVIDSITAVYNNYETQVKTNGKYYLDYYDKLVSLAMQVIDLPKMPADLNDPVLQEIPQNKEIFIRSDVPILKQLYSLIRYERGCLYYYLLQEKYYWESSNRLMAFLQRRYRIKEE